MKTMKLPAGLPAFAALGLLAVAGGLVALAAPSAPSSAAAAGAAAHKAANVTQAPALSGAAQSASGNTQTRILTGATTPAVPTATTAPQPTATDTPSAAPTATPAPPAPTATPTQPPAPSWHTVGSYSGSTAQTLPSFTTANPWRLDFSCTVQSGAGFSFAVQADGVNIGGFGDTCDGQSPTSGAWGSCDTGLCGSHTFVISEGQGNGVLAQCAWTAVIEEWY